MHEQLKEQWIRTKNKRRKIITYVDDDCQLRKDHEQIKEFISNNSYPSIFAKAYKPKSNSVCNSQILFEDYTFEKAEIVLKEMIEIKSLELVENDLVTERIKLYIGYSKDRIESTGGSVTLSKPTNVFTDLEEVFLKLYRKTTNRNVAIRRIGVYFEKVSKIDYEQLDLFVDQAKLEKERKLEKTISQVKNKHGKNAILRGMNLVDGATAKIRNTLIGGHNGQ